MYKIYLYCPGAPFAKWIEPASRYDAEYTYANDHNEPIINQTIPGMKSFPQFCYGLITVSSGKQADIGPIVVKISPRQE